MQKVAPKETLLNFDFRTMLSLPWPLVAGLSVSTHGQIVRQSRCNTKAFRILKKAILRSAVVQLQEMMQIKKQLKIRRQLAKRMGRNFDLCSKAIGTAKGEGFIGSDTASDHWEVNDAGNDAKHHDGYNSHGCKMVTTSSAHP